MRLSTVLLAVLLPACGFSSNSSHDGGSGGEGGGGSDGHDAPPDATQCFGSYVRVCFDSAAAVPTAPLTLNSDIDTATSASCDTHNDKKDVACVVAAAGLTVPLGTTIRGTGAKPLILLSTAAVDIAGKLDVSSSRAGGAGAGAAAEADCPGATAALNNSGGFGGSFGGQGGNGEAVDGGGSGGQAAPPLSTFPTKLRGGCPGGAGATTDMSGMSAGAGGRGGGAVLIIAQSIRIAGQINASGAGGAGGPGIKSGGGGGGSGGMIVLDSASITGAGLLFANGGGGGQGGTGGTGASSGAGDPGQESLGPTLVARGGENSSRLGGSGGAGSAGASNNGKLAGGGATSTGGGGAGGGGAGFIHAPGLATATIAPASKDL